MLTFQMIMIIIIGVLVSALIINRVHYYRQGKIVLESKLRFLTPGETYEILYGWNIFGLTKRYSIIPQENHKTILTESTYYNGRVDVTIQVRAGSLIVYSASLRNSKAIYSSETTSDKDSSDDNDMNE